MPTKIYEEYDLYEIEQKLTRTYVKACDFFETNDILLQSFDIALQLLADAKQPA